MISDQLTVAEMVDGILVRFETLDPRRKYMFIKWLQAHGDQVNRKTCKSYWFSKQ